MSGPYAGYVIAVYLVAFVLVGGLAVWTVMGARQARRDLARVEAESAKFGSSRPAGGGRVQDDAR